jgi:hypothetical protein
MALEAPLRVPSGVVHEFRLTLGDGSSVIVGGRVVHLRPHPKQTENRPT